MDNQQMLEELASRYTRLTELSFDMIVVYDINGRILYVNDTGIAMLGASREQVIGQSTARFVHPDYMELLRQRMEFMFKEKGRRTIPAELRLIDMKGNVIDVEVTGLSIPYEDQPAVLAIVRDISERKRH